MNLVSFSTLREDEQRSPSGKFHSFCRNVSVALGCSRNTGTWAGGHPFDFQIRRVPSGAAVCPFHAHLAQWEAFLVRAGHGTLRVGDERVAVRPGDVFVHPPGEPHQLINTGDTELEVFVFADNPPLDGFVYPDSSKWGLRPPGKFFRITETDYFDGEDVAPANETAPRHRPAPAAEVAPPPFARRKLHLDDIPWETWSSPKGRFGGTSKELSIALGAARNAPTGLGGHPFDLEYGKLAPGQCGCPMHSHAAQWELFIFLEGTATVRANDETRVLHGGDAVLHPPGETHQFTNTGDTDLHYLLVADNPPVDYWFYPDSNKWGLRSPRQFFRIAALDYYDGEE